MALQMFYRGIWFAKDFINRYLNYVFKAAEKEQIIFTDGTRKIRFSSTPYVVKHASWTTRQLPAVLVGRASGGMNYITFAKDNLKSDRVLLPGGTQVAQYITVGGDFALSIQLMIRATTIEERDNLVDITGIYLAHPDAKDYFGRHYLVLPEAPSLGSERELSEPGIDYPIYETILNLSVISRWQEWTSTESDRLLNIVSNIEVERTLSD